MITAELLTKLGASKVLAEKYASALDNAIHQYDIDGNKLRVQHFLAQIFHESGRLLYNKELASGAAYEGRKDLGNTQPGDGVRFKGRGFIQITGRANYITMAKDLAIDCVNHPEMIELPQYAAMSAAWFWSKHGLNALADADDFQHITKRINGGTNGLDDRKHFLDLAKTLLP